MCLKEKSIAKMQTDMMMEAIITIVALLWSSGHVGQDTLCINSLYTSEK
jgi:hypothetical protein